jgi:Ca2+-binding EF-hand superfamily protein
MVPAPLSARGSTDPQCFDSDYHVKAFKPTTTSTSDIKDGFPSQIKAVLEDIQAYVFKRRIRVKEAFKDYDNLRCGRCTKPQFLRVLNNLVPGVSLTASQMSSIADVFVDMKPNLCQPQVVNYLNFVRAVDSVFAVPDLEKMPTLKVPRPGSTLSSLSFQPNPCDDEDLLQHVLRRIALLIKTRGITFRELFQDAERSYNTSLLCPRHGGKVTESQFLQHFPFISDISEHKLSLILQRYSTISGDVNYSALDNDLQEITLEPPPSQASTRRAPLSARSYVYPGPATVSVLSARRPGSFRVPTPYEDSNFEAELLARLKAMVASNRLRVYGCFQEMDKLRRGVCTWGQARTVFTILRLDMNPKELDALAKIFVSDGQFRYLEFCDIVNEVPLYSSEEQSSMFQSTRQASIRENVERTRVQPELLPQAQALLDETEHLIAKRMLLRTVNAREHFKDFDKASSGRVTRSQCLRVIDGLQLNLSRLQLEVILEAYSDLSGQEFYYFDFLNSISRKMKELSGLSRRTGATPEPSKYFTRKGQIIPLNSPTRTPPMTARPFTR